MTKKDKHEINKTIKELKKFMEICDKAYVECGFNQDKVSQKAALVVLKYTIQNRIYSLRQLKYL
jgi:hypothetical protein